MKVVGLFNHRNLPIGVAKYHKKNGTVELEYDTDAIHYGDVTLTFEEFEEYKGRMNIKTEYDIGQMELF